MGVQLNIKDPETVRLARELAKMTGKSVTDTVRTALEDEARRREVETAGRLARLDEIVASVQAKLTPEQRRITSKDAMESIYDDGLPA